MACGSLDAPMAGVPAQYQNRAACMTACAGFDKTHDYGSTAVGNSLACRLFHATNAAQVGLGPAVKLTHCPHTSATPTGPCAGPPAP
jgi:hypothetical protein